MGRSVRGMGMSVNAVMGAVGSEGITGRMAWGGISFEGLGVGELKGECC